MNSIIFLGRFKNLKCNIQERISATFLTCKSNESLYREIVNYSIHTKKHKNEHFYV